MPFRESGVSSREKLKVSQEQQAILETPTKQPKTQEEISVEIKESALRTERSLLSDQELLSSAGERASAELKQKAKKYMANVLLIHTDRLISQTPNNLIENYNANRLSLEAINGLALTLVQTNPESMTILGVSGELEELKCTEDNAGEFLRAVQLLDEVVGGNSAELQKELLRIQNTQEQHNNGIESLQSRFKKLFVGNSQRLEALGKPEIQELFNDFESEINGQNAEIEHDRARADQLILEIRKLEDRVKAGEVSDAELKEKQTEFASLKTDYSQAVLDKALQICSRPELSLGLNGKAIILSYILEKYDKYTAIDHCFGMCKDVERLIDQSFGNNKLDYTINVDLMRQKLARDLANPNNTSEINFIISDIIGDPVVRYSEIQTKLMNSLHAENINDLRAQISLGARLHNIGKICVPLSLIDGKMKPSDSQFDQIAVHVKKGEQILKKFGFPKEIVVMALYHHTRKDVYRKLLGLDDGTNNESIIPIQTKLIEIIDVYNALTTPRSYRPSVHSRLSALNITKSMIGNDQEYKELFKLFVKYLLN